MQVGERINIIKDINIECSLLKIIEKAREVVSFQLRDFITLNKETGKSATTVNKRIKKLIDESLIVRVGDKSDPKHYLELKNK